jgi:hypothetical protein
MEFKFPITEQQRIKEKLMYLLNYGGDIKEIKKLQKIVEEDNNEK